MGVIFSAPHVGNVAYKGIFDFNGVNDLIYNWLQEKHYLFMEHKYKHKFKHLGYEIQRDWEAKKEITEYVRYRIKIFLHTWDMNDIEVVKEGKKVKIQRGRIEISLDCEVELDWQGRFETSKFFERMRAFLHKYVIKNEVVIKHVDFLFYEVLGLQQELKKFFKMETAETAKYR